MGGACFPYPRVQLQLPDDFEGLALGIIVEAGHTDDVTVTGIRVKGLDQVVAHPHIDDLAALGKFGVCGDGG